MDLDPDCSADESPSKRPRTAAPEDFHSIVSVKEKYIKKFGAHMYDYSIQFTNLEDASLHEALPLLNEMCNGIITRLGQGVEHDDKVRIVFNSPVFQYP